MFLGGCALEAVSPLWRNEYKEAEEEEELTEEEKLIESTENFNVNIRQLSTHGLGEEQLKSKFKVALNRMSISWTWWLDKYILFVSCMPEDKGGWGGVSKNHVEVKGGQQKSSMAYFTLHQPPPLDK